MINNLSKYISDNSAIVPVTNGYNPDSTTEGVALTQSGGSDTSRGLKVDYQVQLISRASSTGEAYRLIQVVFNLLINRFGIVLPAVTVNSIVFPEVTAEQMIPIQEPGYIGADDNGLHQWSVNFQVTIRR